MNQINQSKFQLGGVSSLFKVLKLFHLVFVGCNVEVKFKFSHMQIRQCLPVFAAEFLV